MKPDKLGERERKRMLFETNARRKCMLIFSCRNNVWIFLCLNTCHTLGFVQALTRTDRQTIFVNIYECVWRRGRKIWLASNVMIFASLSSWFQPCRYLTADFHVYYVNMKDSYVKCCIVNLDWYSPFMIE